MLLLLLLPLLPKLLQSLETTGPPPVDTPDPPRTLQKTITDCPSVGYFFERQTLPGHPGACYLCYCKDDGLAGCTLRESARCDAEDNSYQKDVEAVQRTGPRRRTRRNPGLMDLFFNDVKKDIVLKSMAQANEEDCKPRDSKSIGCPPTDWCKGCLVCDCDDNREWQCHVMSFCEDKTPKPRNKKLKKSEIKETDTSEQSTKKNNKRSVKPKKKNPKKVPPSSTTTTTTKKPGPAVPQIAVKTLKKFIRKDQMKNGTANLLVIKKYISTISPIESPELLKYKNDSRKLAQLLYQQYAPKEVHHDKREIRLEKIFNSKPKRNFELKYNARGRKPMNVKEHSDWNKKMKKKNAKRENKPLNKFYSKQNALINPGEKNETEVEEEEDNQIKGNYKRKEKVIYIPRKRRNKRELPATTEISTDTTIVENDIVNISTVDSNLATEAPATLFGNNEEIASNLNNYKYTVDDIGTQTYNYENGTLNYDVVHDTTLKYEDLVTTQTIDFLEENFTETDILNYTNVDDESTTQLNYNSQTFAFNNYTLRQIRNPSDSQLTLMNNQSLETTTLMDYNLDVIPITDKELKGEYKGNMGTTTTNTTIEWPINETQEINNTYNKTSNLTNASDINNVNLNTIIKNLNPNDSQKNIEINKTNVTGPNLTSRNKTMKSFKTDFDKMLESFSNNYTKHKPQQNGIIAIKYLKKLYSQLLSKKTNKTRITNIVVMESICDTFGPCKISTNKVGLLNYKVHELIIEAKKALEVIKVIKKHLQLVHNKYNDTADVNDEVEFKRYVKQLNAIITGNYETPLTEKEMTQMHYVKNKTKVFINSVGNFASILNDILKIIRSERIKYDNIKKRRKFIINRVTRHKVDSPLQKIKSLFLKFNLLQNTFMHNMYQAISELERQNNETSTDLYKTQASQRDNRYKTSVNKYMNKINYNLEKLKELALKMGAKQRRKRNVMRNDDAVEYLLTLMEYLLKQNNPVDKPPVADGIDLLIDAIRRAPDIKPIKQKVLIQMSSAPPSSYLKPMSKSSSESEEDGRRNIKGKFKENFSFEKPYSNDTLILSSNNEESEKYINASTDIPNQSVAVTTTKYVDVEDLVFNGDVVEKVYMATVPPYENTDETYSEKEEMKPKNAKSKINGSISSSTEDDTLIMMTKTSNETETKTENYTSSTDKIIKTQFDRLNEEYEKELKVKAPSVKGLKLKRRKNKRLRKKQKEGNKSDVSTITKEVDEEKTRKKVVAEEAVLRKQIVTSDVDPFQSMDDESASRDLAPLALDPIENEVFPSYFTK